MRRLARPALAFLTALALSQVGGPAPWLTPAAVAQDAAPTIIDSLRWRAWVDAMPGPGRRAHPFYVTGEIVLPTPGYKVSLVPDKRSVQAPVLILDLQIERVRPPDAQVTTSYNPRYDDTQPPRRYSGVVVRYQGRTLATIERISTIH